MPNDRFIGTNELYILGLGNICSEKVVYGFHIKFKKKIPYWSETLTEIFLSKSNANAILDGLFTSLCSIKTKGIQKLSCKEVMKVRKYHFQWKIISICHGVRRLIKYNIQLIYRKEFFSMWVHRSRGLLQSLGPLIKTVKYNPWKNSVDMSQIVIQIRRNFAQTCNSLSIFLFFNPSLLGSFEIITQSKELAIIQSI